MYHLLSQLVAKTVSGAEDPEKMLDQAVNEMQSDLVRLRQASAQVRIIANSVMLKKVTSTTPTASPPWLSAIIVLI